MPLNANLNAARATRGIYGFVKAGKNAHASGAFTRSASRRRGDFISTPYTHLRRREFARESVARPLRELLGGPLYAIARKPFVRAYRDCNYYWPLRASPWPTTVATNAYMKGHAMVPMC